MDRTSRTCSRIFDSKSYTAEELALIEDVIGFDRAFYVAEYKDVDAAGMNAVEHYLRYGIDEGRRPADQYKTRQPNSSQTWLEEIIGFDPDFYARAYPDISSDYSYHLVLNGLREGRLPYDVHENIDSERVLYSILEKIGLSRTTSLDIWLHLCPNDWVSVASTLQSMSAHLPIKPKPYRNNYWLALAISHLARGEFGLATCCYNFFFNAYVPSQWLGSATEWLIGTGRIIRIAEAMIEQGGVLASPEVALSTRVTDPVFLNRPRKPPESVEIILPQPVYGTLSDVEVLGNSSLIVKKGHTAYYDYTEDGPRPRDLQCPNLIHVIGDRCSYRVPLKKRSVDQAYWMLHDHGHNYHHWLLEILPRYLLALQNGLPPSVPLLVDKGMAPQMHEILRLIFDGLPPLIEVERNASVIVKRLYAMTDLCVNTVHTEDEPRRSDVLISPTVIHMLRTLARPYLTDLNGRLAYVQISRSNVAHRRLINSAHLQSTMEGAGFWSFDPGAASWIQQVRVFSNARLIVAEAGASLANLIFCRPGATVIVLVQGHRCSNYFYLCQIAELVGVRLFFFECLRLEGSHTIGVQEDMIAPLGALNEWVTRFVADPDFDPVKSGH